MASTEVAERPPQLAGAPCPCALDGYLCPGARMLAAPSADELYAAGLRAARRWQAVERRQLFRWTRESL